MAPPRDRGGGSRSTAAAPMSDRAPTAPLGTPDLSNREAYGLTSRSSFRRLHRWPPVVSGHCPPMRSVSRASGVASRRRSAPPTRPACPAGRRPTRSTRGGTRSTRRSCEPPAPTDRGSLTSRSRGARDRARWTAMTVRDSVGLARAHGSGRGVARHPDPCTVERPPRTAAADKRPRPTWRRQDRAGCSPPACPDPSP
jgi:hypothetical protein